MEMPYARTSLRGSQRKMHECMRAAGLDHRQIAVEFSRIYKLRPRAAWRHAYGLSLQEAADSINAYKGDNGLDPGGLSGMTAPHLSEHENWPGHGDIPTGRKPSPYLIAVLASIYNCEVSDLIDLADRQHLPAKDLLILDTYAPRADREKAIPHAPTGPADAGGSSYVVFVLPRDTQRILIDVARADEFEPHAQSLPARRLRLAGD